MGESGIVFRIQFCFEKVQVEKIEAGASNIEI